MQKKIWIQKGLKGISLLKSSMENQHWSIMKYRMNWTLGFSVSSFIFMKRNLKQSWTCISNSWLIALRADTESKADVQTALHFSCVIVRLILLSLSVCWCVFFIWTSMGDSVSEALLTSAEILLVWVITRRACAGVSRRNRDDVTKIRALTRNSSRLQTTQQVAQGFRL